MRAFDGGGVVLGSGDDALQRAIALSLASSATSLDATPETPARGDVPGGAPSTLTATERRERREAAACAAEMRRDLESARKRPREEEGL